MISWIQRYFQKHFRLVFLAVLIAIGLPMVVIYSSSGGGRGESIKVLDRPFFGINLDNPEQMRRVGLDAELSVYLRAGYPALQATQLRQYSLQRVAGLALADQLHLPTATPDQVAKYVPTLRAFQNEQGLFDQSAYTKFADSLKSGAGATVADVNRVLRDDARLAELAKILGGPGYLQPVDVKLQLTRADSSWTVQVASLDYASFSPALNPTEDALKKFHEENSFRYDVPARPKISVVELKAADFKVSTIPTEEQLRAFYNANIASFPVPADADKKDAKDATAPVDNFPKVRDQVQTALVNAASRRIASEAANQVTLALFEKKLTANSPQLADFLASLHHPAVAVPAFSPARPPADRPWLTNFSSQMSRLNRERFFSDPLPTPDGYVILLWNDSLPAYSPSLIEVHDQVAADYRTVEKRRLFNERGNALKAQLQAAAATPTGFADKAAAEKLDVKSYASFTLRQPPQDLPGEVGNALQTLEAGQVSSFIGTEDKGLIVFAQAKKLPDLTPANPRYAEIQRQFTAMVANYGENTILGDLTEAELKKTGAGPEAIPEDAVHPAKHPPG